MQQCRVSVKYSEEIKTPSSGKYLISTYSIFFSCVWEEEAGRGGRLFEAGRLLTFSASRMGAYSRWTLIRGWALIRINTVHEKT